MVKTAKENGLNPMPYLTHIFEQPANIDTVKDPKALDSLLPWAEPIQSKDRVTSKTTR